MVSISKIRPVNTNDFVKSILFIVFSLAIWNLLTILIEKYTKNPILIYTIILVVTYGIIRVKYGFIGLT